MKLNETWDRAGSEAARTSFNHGLEQAKAGAWAEAVAELEIALRQDPHYGKARNVLGKVYLRQGHGERAEACWRQTLAENPNDVTAQQCLQSLSAVRYRARTAADSEGLFRVAVLALGLVILIWIYSFGKEMRESNRAAEERSRITQEEIRDLRRHLSEERGRQAAATSAPETPGSAETTPSPLPAARGPSP
ncbi:MAG: tetratricopeptide repeat protein [Acidobacteria bacterium]|nr:tetratricopeptide repeat protein [Acidobacteriota bacterium]MBI3656920.1 tetratricopeptide repeat protein [Acidobacteriota bacterium]